MIAFLTWASLIQHQNLRNDKESQQKIITIYFSSFLSCAFISHGGIEWDRVFFIISENHKN